MGLTVLMTTMKILRGAQETKNTKEIRVRRRLVLLLLFFLRMAVADGA